MTVGVHLLFFDKSFTLSVHKEFAVPGTSPGGQMRVATMATPVPAALTPAPSPFDKLLSPQDWQTYCQAFA